MTKSFVQLCIFFSTLLGVMGSRNILTFGDFQQQSFPDSDLLSSFNVVTGQGDVVEIPQITETDPYSDIFTTDIDVAAPPSPPEGIIILPQPSPVAQEVVDEFNQQREIWDNSSITFYNFTITRSCFCQFESVQPVSVSVCNETVTVPEFYEDMNTIDKVFAFVEGILAEPLASVNIQYDPFYGFITDFFVDKDEFIADEEIGYTVSDFSVLTEETCSPF